MLASRAEASNNQKLMLEYEKYQELQAKSQQIQEQYENQLAELKEQHERQKEETSENYEAKLADKTAALQHVRPSLWSVLLI